MIFAPFLNYVIGDFDMNLLNKPHSRKRGVILGNLSNHIAHLGNKMLNRQGKGVDTIE